jgi:hypothetical protein
MVEEPADSQVLVVPLQDGDPGPPFQELSHWELQQKTLRAEVGNESGRGKQRFKTRGLLVDTWYSQAVLDFLPPRM